LSPFNTIDMLYSGSRCAGVNSVLTDETMHKGRKYVFWHFVSLQAV